MYSLVYKYIFLILTVELSNIESKGMKTKNQSITYLVVVIFLYGTLTQLSAAFRS